MPKNFTKILDNMKLKLKGKTNPKTKKKYSNSEVYAIAVSAYKKKYGNAPTKEESPKWYFDGRKEIRENVNLNWAQVIEFDKEKKSSVNSPLVIKGRAINETITSNRVKYINEELDMAAPSLIGKPILNSHNHNDVRETLGVVIGSEKVAGGLNYVAEIDPDERKVINKIKRGYISKVSICADCKTLEKEQVEEGDKVFDVYVARGMTFKELSLVTVPGDKDSSINVSNAISESFNINESDNELISDLMSEDLSNPLSESDEKIEDVLLSKKKEMDEMSEEKINKIEEMEAKYAAVLKEKEEMSKQLKVIEQEKAEKAKEDSLKNLISEAVKKELQQFKQVKEQDAEQADSEEKGKVQDADEDVEKIKEKLGDAYSNLIIERGSKGSSFFYMPKEASNSENIYKRWIKNELQ